MKPAPSDWVEQVGIALLPAPAVWPSIRQVMGTLHGSDVFSVSCPEIATATAISVAHLAKTG